MSPAVHCWTHGPDVDGCSTTCMLPDKHEGPHHWTRDDEISIHFSDDHIFQCERCGGEDIEPNIEAFELSGECVCNECADQIFEDESAGVVRAK
jgi:hypothetical protein